MQCSLIVDQPTQTHEQHLALRRKVHAQVSAELEGLGDTEILRLVSNPQTLEFGHAVTHLPMSNAKVFGKLVPLTAREMQPDNRQSTANLFRTPSHYQYRVGTCGGSAWRELQAQQRASDWVLAGQSSSFPLLHHWRILPLVARAGYDDRLNVGPWGGCREIRERLSEVQDATSSLVMFMEYFPRTLLDWLSEELLVDAEPERLVARIEGCLREQLAFVGRRGMLHLDAHFANILTDGERLYLADFGLALSRDFQLDADEVTFFENHQNFDICTATNSVVRAAVLRYAGAPNWRRTLRNLDEQRIPPAMRAYLARRAPLALKIGEFYDRLLNDCTTPFPAAELQELLERQ